MKARLLAFWLIIVASGMAWIGWSRSTGPTPPAGANASEQRTAQYFESIRNQPVKLQAFLRNLPKGADLHTHLSGAVYAETFMKWAIQKELCIDPATFKVFDTCAKGQVKLNKDLFKNDTVPYAKVIDAWSMRNWQYSGKNGHDQFFGTFGLWGPLTKQLGQMMAEVRSRAAAGNVSYLEIMLTPDGGASWPFGENLTWQENFNDMRDQLTRAGLLDKVIAAEKQLLDQAEQTAKDELRCRQSQPDPGCDVEVRYIFQIGRTNPPQQVFTQMFAAFETVNRDSRVVALNLVQPEDNIVAMGDFSLHMRMLDYFHSIYPHVNITLHAGELAPGLVPPEGMRSHIRDSVEIAHAKRIGHGVDLMYERDADQLLQQMASRNVMVEICLTSNDVILGVRGEKHPVRAYMAAGVPVALATDDEGVARSDITREYLKAVEDHNVTYGQFKNMTRTSLEHAFISGQSLWQSFGSLQVASQCAGDRPDGGTLSQQCQQFLNSNRKAELQWNHERNLAAFESRHQ
jgi:adenosine deaminase